MEVRSYQDHAKRRWIAVCEHPDHGRIAEYGDGPKDASRRVRNRIAFLDRVFPKGEKEDEESGGLDAGRSGG